MVKSLSLLVIILHIAQFRFIIKLIFMINYLSNMLEREIYMKPLYQLPSVELSLDYIEKIERIYAFEEKVMLAVQHGDAKTLHELFEKTSIIKDMNAHLQFRLPDDLLRHQKNNHVILNSLLRAAAKKGGLSVIYLHTISEKFAIAIESTTSLEYLANYFGELMCIEYANAVALFSTKDYSPIIKEVIRYITSNITINISLSDLANRFHVNPSYLSSKFKEDTKMSLTTYINYQRVELSKYYFENNMENITEVAFKVGYNDSSYFTKIFKKITGILPKEYLKNLHTR